ncbi:hypothetical protein JR316_0000306 [Psilocybe cubensis]|uniref:Uncharacterized protein n=1 Tax=Psilocybe cubensis TaxID=181762 RepID=A0ACB8HEV9_PSICU|nr:hypothetical protein JR316_0000306 [Psilocybe cubensis]KAH9486242.1 hypothetical protein JR316_0000306 [Psilocybe cubensis]
MFSKQSELVLPDLSPDLRDEFDWKVGSLRSFDFPLNITSLAIEPVNGLLGIGTSSGDVHIFGRPGVESILHLPQPVDVRFLQFSVSTSNIVCLDGNNQLHVYSLAEYGRPKHVSSSRFDQTNSITLSPSHTHVFLASQSGEIKTYDLTCLRKSPYTTPNLWKLYEEKLAASGMPSLAPNFPYVVEIVIHPRNLDLLFVAYSGGVVLTDLTERNTIRVYELTLSPGAPGGSGYAVDDILTHRRIMVTCLAIHPSGHMLAVGYADGSIAFWAVEDDNKPILVRTLDTIDVNVIQADLLEKHLSNSGQSKHPSSLPEPIFKLSWSSFENSSDPRGGETVLTVLGGLDSDKPPGLTTLLLPAFNPPEPPSDSPVPGQDTLHPFFRDAMHQSLTPKKSFYYETKGVIQDYLLLPRASPHFGGSYDPYGILLISESNEMRTVEGYQFPPPGFITTAATSSKVVKNISTDEGTLSPPSPTPLPVSPSHVNHTPLPMTLPTALLAGHAGILGGQLIKLPNDIYDNFISHKTIFDIRLNLQGGQAQPDPAKANELKLSKYQPRRVLMSYNKDLSIRFFDFSTQLLIPSAASDHLENDWPEPIPGLTIQLYEILEDPGIAQIFGNALPSLSIQSVLIASEALELAILMKSGEVIVYNSSSHRSMVRSLNQTTDPQIVMLDHLCPRPGCRLAPYFMFVPRKGPVEACALADTGFLAMSYKDGSLFAIDMRGPTVILARGTDKRQKRTSALSSGHLVSPLGHGSGLDVVMSLTWAVAHLEKDPSLGVRLIAGHQSGHAEVYTLVHSGNHSSWSIAGEPMVAKVMPDPITGGTFVLDSKSGAQCKVDRTRLGAAMKGTNSSRDSHCILVSVGVKGARTTVDITGAKVGKVDWGNKHGSVQDARIVEHADSRTLVIQTDRHMAVIYSLPHLEHVHTVQLPVITSLPLSIDESGDFIAWTLAAQARSAGVMQSATYGTFFDVRRAYTLPVIDFMIGRGTIPPQPQPVPLGPTSILGSWFTYNQTKTGQQIDELLGGPSRPIPVKPSPASTSKDTPAEGSSSPGSGIIAGAAAVQANLYNRFAAAMNERGQLLGDLNERFNSLEEGSRNMVAQAKSLAAKQTAKSWFGL